MDDRLMTVKEAAAYCGVNERTIRAWMASGQLTALKSNPKSPKSAVRLRESEVKNVFRPAEAGQA